MKSEQTNKKLPEELSDIVNLVVGKHHFSPKMFSMFNKQERFALYEAIGDEFLKNGYNTHANSAYTAEGRELSVEKKRALGDCWFGAGDYLYAFEYYESISSQVPKERFVKIGESFLASDLELAEKCYALANQELPSERLVIIGNAVLKRGDVFKAEVYYKLANKKISKKKILKVVDKLLNEGRVSSLKRAYEIAGKELPVKKIIAKADEFVYLRETRFNRKHSAYALELYALVKDKVPTEKILELARVCFRSFEPRKAIKALELAGQEVTSERLIKEGEYYLEDDGLETAMETFELAKKKATPQEQVIINDKITLVGDAYLWKSSIYQAIEAYDSINRKIPLGKLIRAAEITMDKNEFGNAKEIYKLAKIRFPVERVVEYADKMLALGEPHEAESIYEFANQAVPPNKQLAFAQAFIRQAGPTSVFISSKDGIIKAKPKDEITKAKQYFELAGHKKTASFLEKFLKG